MASSTTSNVKQEERNWLDLPRDVTFNILNKVDMISILESVERVCTWHKICKDPAMWRVINMNDLQRSIIAKRKKQNYHVIKLGHHVADRSQGRYLVDITQIYDYGFCETYICKHVLDRSQGQLVDITIRDHGNELLLYVADRSSKLRRLEILYGKRSEMLTEETLMKFPLLEELNLYGVKVSKEEIVNVGRYCPMLKTLKVIEELPLYWIDFIRDQKSFERLDALAIAIGQNLVELRCLELIGNNMTNYGLQVILDNCRSLETLDLRACLNLDLEGDLGKKCCDQIKYLKLPNDSLEGFPYFDELVYEVSDDYDDCPEFANQEENDRYTKMARLVLNAFTALDQTSARKLNAKDAGELYRRSGIGPF